MKSYRYVIGEVALLFLSGAELPSLTESLDMSEKYKTDGVVCLSPSLSSDGEITLFCQAPHLYLCEALCVAAYHLSNTRGLPLLDYTFIYKNKKYDVSVEKTDGKICLKGIKCKQILTNLDISRGEYQLSSSLYDGFSKRLILGVDNLACVSGEHLFHLLSRMETAVRAPLIVYQKENIGDNVSFHVFGEGGEVTPDLFSRIVLYRERMGKNYFVTSSLGEFSLALENVGLKIAPRRE